MRSLSKNMRCHKKNRYSCNWSFSGINRASYEASHFCNTVGRVCKFDLTLRRTSKAKKSLRPNYSAISTSMVEWVSWVGLVLSSPSSEMMVGRLVNQRDTVSHTVADCLCHVQQLQTLDQSCTDNKYGLLDWSVYWSLFCIKNKQEDPRQIKLDLI